MNDRASDRLDRASATLANSVWMLAIPLVLGLVSCGMGINAYIKVSAAEEAIEQALDASPPIHLLDEGQCSAHSYGDDVVCAASWWEPSEEEGRYYPAGSMEMLEILENSESEFLIVGGLSLLLILVVILKVRKARRILDLPGSSD